MQKFPRPTIRSGHQRLLPEPNTRKRIHLNSRIYLKPENRQLLVVWTEYIVKLHSQDEVHLCECNEYWNKNRRDNLRCQPEGRGFDYRWCHWNFLLT
jgi:hypothetical protein